MVKLVGAMLCTVCGLGYSRGWSRGGSGYNTGHVTAALIENTTERRELCSSPAAAAGRARVCGQHSRGRTHVTEVV